MKFFFLFLFISFGAFGDNSSSEAFLYPEIGRKLFPGTKCHFLCKDFKEEDGKKVFSLECQKCAGISGHVPEEFDYLLTKSGACFEVDQTARRFYVDKSFCLEAKSLIVTEYINPRSLFQWMTQESGDCVEVDEKTQGDIFKTSAEEEMCSGSGVNDDERNEFPDRGKKPYKYIGPSGVSAQ